eukprot:scaffold116337_cov32-Tisochrysis_lutea.AAC.4
MAGSQSWHRSAADRALFEASTSVCAAAALVTPRATSRSHLPLAPDHASRSATSTTPAESRSSKSGILRAMCAATVRHEGDGCGDVAPNGDARSPSTMKRTEAALASAIATVAERRATTGCPTLSSAAEGAASASTSR